MEADRITKCLSRNDDPQGQVMKTQEDVSEMLRLKACGWGLKRIARELGCSHHTVKHYVAAGGVVPFRAARSARTLDGHEDWLRERFLRHRGNADVVRQDLLAEKGLAVSRRTLQRAVEPLSSGAESRGTGDGAVRDATGPPIAYRFWRASGRDWRREGESLRVRCDARIFAARACPCVPAREAGELVHGP